jgi:hypothetical protein
MLKLYLKPVTLLENGSKLTLLCHPSEKYTSYIVGATGDPQSIKVSCESKQFTFNSEQFHVESASCSRKHEAKLIKTEGESCAEINYDGTSVKATTDLNLVQIGWNLTGKYHEQIRLCQERITYATLWTRHVVKGASIDLRDMDSSRPSFKRDVTGLKRFFTKFDSQTQLAS